MCNTELKSLQDVFGRFYKGVHLADLLQSRSNRACTDGPSDKNCNCVGQEILLVATTHRATIDAGSWIVDAGSSICSLSFDPFTNCFELS